MGKRRKLALKAAVAAVRTSVLLALAVAGGAAATGAGAGGAGASPAPAPVEYYLDLGGSASVGFQPTAAHPDGQPTDSGYANDLLTIERARWPGLHLVELGCPGQTTGTFLNGGDPCRPAGQTQLSQAVAFLRTHPDTVLVTIDLGFNDIRRCLVLDTIDQACLTQGLDLIAQQLPPILATLRAAAGPSVRLVGVAHYDPYLGAYLQGGPALDFADDSVAAIAQLNDTLHAIYAAARVPVANVAQAFGMDQSKPEELAGVGDVPRNVQRACALTWMCTSSSPQAKQHPNDAGYQVIAQAIAAAIPA